MKSILSISFLVVFVVSSVSCSTVVKKEEREPASTSASGTISKEQFLNNLGGLTMPVAFCTPDIMFRKCTTLTEDQCIQRASLAVKACINEIKNEIPDAISSREEAQNWGRRIGSCAGVELIKHVELYMKEVKINEPCMIEEGKKYTQQI